MGVSGNFLLPSQVKQNIANKTTKNVSEISQFERAITPDLAEAMRDMAYAYPSMDKRLVAYLPLMGLKADDEDTLKIAQTQQRAQEISETSK